VINEKCEVGEKNEIKAERQNCNGLKALKAQVFPGTTVASTNTSMSYHNSPLSTLPSSHTLHFTFCYKKLADKAEKLPI